MSCVYAGGGAELLGDGRVRIVYVDEAGIGDVESEPILVVTGVIVQGDHQLNADSAQLA